jgi:hypothetical protein
MSDGFAVSAEKRGPTGWKAQLQSLIDEHGGKPANGKPVSFPTQELTAAILFSVFETLDELGFRLEEPRDFSERHVLALARHWHQKGHGIGTIQNTIPVLRVFCIWIDKEGMIESVMECLDEVPSMKRKRHTSAENSKRWTKEGKEALEFEEHFKTAALLHDLATLLSDLKAKVGAMQQEVEKVSLLPAQIRQGLDNCEVAKIHRTLADNLRAKLTDHTQTQAHRLQVFSSRIEASVNAAIDQIHDAAAGKPAHPSASAARHVVVGHQRRAVHLMRACALVQRAAIATIAAAGIVVIAHLFPTLH